MQLRKDHQQQTIKEEQQI